MKFKYTIRSRVHGRATGDNLYRGTVEAKTFKAAMLAALAEEFGDKADGPTPYDQLVKAGWMDEADYEYTFGDLEDDADSATLESDNTFFDIEVEEADCG
jgi:hypothetical protein